jgi:hypothetical protein
MDELHEELEEGGVSRRDALKKMGVTAAGFWAVPVISSFASKAYAAHQSPICTGHNFVCGGAFVVCGTGIFGDCFCDVDTEGNAGCFENSPCAPTCTSSTECPPGNRCISTCCGANCVPECGLSASVESAGGQTQLGL